MGPPGNKWKTRSTPFWWPWQSSTQLTCLEPSSWHSKTDLTWAPKFSSNSFPTSFSPCTRPPSVDPFSWPSPSPGRGTSPPTTHWTTIRYGHCQSHDSRLSSSQEAVIYLQVNLLNWKTDKGKEWPDLDQLQSGYERQERNPETADQICGDRLVFINRLQHQQGTGNECC